MPDTIADQKIYLDIITAHSSKRHSIPIRTVMGLFRGGISSIKSNDHIRQRIEAEKDIRPTYRCGDTDKT